MAFEGLFLEMFLLKSSNLVRGQSYCIEFVRQCKLDIETNFKMDLKKMAWHMQTHMHTIVIYLTA